MSVGRRLALLVAGTLLAMGDARAGDDPCAERVVVAGGAYAPFYPGADGQPVQVEAFALDPCPVTNAAFAQFVAQSSSWQRGAPPSILADVSYLAHWATDDAPGADLADQPVTRVSYFAASRYCEWAGGRLPTEDEWEMAASAGEHGPDGRAEPAHVRRILDWYGRPGTAPLPDVPAGPANFYGVHDLHGVVWEWVSDFNASMVGSTRRADDASNYGAFCGAGAMSAADPRDYAAFMRFAFRSTLRGTYTSRNLGFRCAADLEEIP